MPPDWNYKKANWKSFTLNIDNALNKIKVNKTTLKSKVQLFKNHVFDTEKKVSQEEGGKTTNPFVSKERKELHIDLSNLREHTEMNPID